MADPVTIPARRSDPFGLDYESLRAEGVTLVQALSGEIWTDYNEHDPGVTTLEQLCYALTELGYRAAFSIPDLLAPPSPERFDPARHALYVAREIFPVEPVTIGDYRKLLVDRVEEVRNAWLEPTQVDGVGGLYRMVIYVSGHGACLTDAQGRRLDPAARARAVYMAHRDLCEDLAELVVAEELSTRVAALVEIDEGVDADLLLAELLFAAATFLAPELSRRSLDQCLAAGQTPEALFTGPLLHNGFIDDDELQPKRCKIPVRGIGAAMAEVKGVRGVRKLVATVGEQRYGPGDTISIETSQVLTLRTTAERCTDETVVLTRDGVMVATDPVRVQRLLARLWARYRQDHPLRQQYEERLGVPEGEHRDLSIYTSIQDQYPVTYGITAQGLSADATPMRRAQAKQLKAYLLPFEQLMADFFSQLAYVRRLYSTDRELDHTYAHQSLCRSVPDVEPVLDGGCSPEGAYRRGLGALVASQDPVVQRRNALLRFLLALSAEGLDEGSLFDDSAAGNRDLPARLLEARLELLRRVVEVGGRRGHAFDYEGSLSSLDVTGMTIKSRIQLEMPLEHRALGEQLDELGIDLCAPSAAPSLGRDLGRRAEQAASLRPALDSDARHEAMSAEGSDRLRGESISEEFIDAASEPGRFLVGPLPPGEGTALVCTPLGRQGALFLGRHADDEEATRVAASLVPIANAIRRCCQQLFIIEHILLRWAGDDGPTYDFRITAVIATSRHRVEDPDYRRFAAEVIRDNTPAHVVSRCCFLGPCDLLRFEPIYWAWRAALLDPCADRAAACRRLVAFLQGCRSGEEAATA